MEKYGLDFDDAYQYLVVIRNDLLLASYDRDFDATAIRRKRPVELL
jgi:predicted nucleic acid-binding protein